MLGIVNERDIIGETIDLMVDWVRIMIDVRTTIDVITDVMVDIITDVMTDVTINIIVAMIGINGISNVRRDKQR